MKQNSTTVRITGEWMWSDTIANAGSDGAEKVLSRCAEMGITDVYLLVKGTAGKLAYLRTMHTDLLLDNCIFSGGADGFFGDTVLCIFVLCVCGVNDNTIWVSFVQFFDCISGGIGARALSFESFKCGFGFNGGAEN